MYLILFRAKSQPKCFHTSLRPRRQLVLLSAAAALAPFGTLFTVPEKSQAHTYASTTLYGFQGPAFGDGEAPYGALYRDVNGDIYGTTNIGGTDNNGTLFKVTVPARSRFCSASPMQVALIPRVE